MERDKLIELLENGSEAELVLIQNYLLDRILKKMPTESEAVQRCIETSEKIRNLEKEITILKTTVRALQEELNTESSKYYKGTWSSTISDFTNVNSTGPNITTWTSTSTI